MSSFKISTLIEKNSLKEKTLTEKLKKNKTKNKIFLSKFASKLSAVSIRHATTGALMHSSIILSLLLTFA